MFTIPATLGEFLELAYADMKELEVDPRYAVRLEDWHQPRHGVCHICLAGAVMARRFGAVPDQEVADEDYAPPVQKLLQSLDLLSRGAVGRAATRFRDAVKAQGRRYDVKPGLALGHIHYFDPTDDSAARNASIEKTIALLKEAGI